MERTGAEARPQGNLMHLLWEFQACLAEGHTLRVGSPGWHLTLPTPVRRVKLGAIGAGATCCAADPLLT